MKKITSVLSIIILSILLLSACNSNTSSNVLKVGASPVPHSEILNLVKDDLKEQGIELKIIEFTDYVKPNLALSEGEIDANFFQHKPYLDTFSSEHDLNLISIGKIHLEPLGIYSSKYDSIDDLKNGSSIAIPNDPTNGGRALILLENEGLIKLKENAGLNATENDIIKNPKNLEFKPLESAQLPRALGDVDASVINGNYALEADLVPTDDAILLEGSESPYANILAIHKDNENNKKINALLKALQSEEVKNYILKNYNGGVIPAF